MSNAVWKKVIKYIFTLPMISIIFGLLISFIIGLPLLIIFGLLFWGIIYALTLIRRSKQKLGDST